MAELINDKPHLRAAEPSKYTVDQNPRSYLRHFNIVGRGNKWTDAIKCDRFPTALSGDTVVAWYDSLPAAIKSDWALLSTTFEAKFKPDQVTVSRQFQQCQQGTMTISSYYETFQSIIRQMDPAPVVAHQITKFIDGLSSHLRIHVSNNKPTTVEDARDAAISAENYLVPPSSRPVRSIADSSEESLLVMLVQEMKELRAQVYAATAPAASPAAPAAPNVPRYGFNNNDRTHDGKAICHYCREPGHFIRDCPLRKEDMRVGREAREKRNKSPSTPKN